VYDGGSKRRLTLDITDAGLAKQKEAAIYWRAAQVRNSWKLDTRFA
jgi:hypothetical protein